MDTDAELKTETKTETTCAYSVALMKRVVSPTGTHHKPETDDHAALPVTRLQIDLFERVLQQHRDVAASLSTELLPVDLNKLLYDMYHGSITSRIVSKTSGGVMESMATECILDFAFRHQTGDRWSLYSVQQGTAKNVPWKERDLAASVAKVWVSDIPNWSALAWSDKLQGFVRLQTEPLHDADGCAVGYAPVQTHIAHTWNGEKLPGAELRSLGMQLGSAVTKHKGWGSTALITPQVQL